MGGPAGTEGVPGVLLLRQHDNGGVHDGRPRALLLLNRSPNFVHLAAPGSDIIAHCRATGTTRTAARRWPRRTSPRRRSYSGEASAEERADIKARIRQRHPERKLDRQGPVRRFSEHSRGRPRARPQGAGAKPRGIPREPVHVGQVVRRCRRLHEAGQRERQPPALVLRQPLGRNRRAD